MTETTPSTSAARTSAGSRTPGTSADGGATLRRWSATAFALAVVAGIVETVVSATVLTAQGADDGLGPQVLVRSAVFTVALVCAWFLARGARWAWWALLIGLGVVGLASMVVPMAAEIAAGATWSGATGGDTSAVLPPVRLAHIGLVLVGVATMLRPRVRASLGRL